MVEIDAAGLARGVGRMLVDMGFAWVAEFRLSSGRRADLCSIDRRGTILIVEIKSSVSDFRADQKWPEYRAHCDRLYFAVSAHFPVAILPPDTGLIIADRYGGLITRAAPEHRLAAAARRKEMLRFGRQAAMRLSELIDPVP